MTCVVGLVWNGLVWMGADSMAADGWNARITNVKKVFKRDDFLIGYSTSFRMGQLLRYTFNIEPRASRPIVDYMVTSFVENLRECLKSHGYSSVENNQEAGGDILVGHNGRLFHIASDFQVNEYADGYTAVGCGTPYALATLRITEDLLPEERVMKALDVAAYFSNGVCEPFYMEQL